VAPHANIVVYDACASDCPTSALVAASTSGGRWRRCDQLFDQRGDNPYYDTVALAMLEARAAGIFVAASAGNGGPGTGAPTIPRRG